MGPNLFYNAFQHSGFHWLVRGDFGKAIVQSLINSEVTFLQQINFVMSIAILSLDMYMISDVIFDCIDCSLGLMNVKFM